METTSINKVILKNSTRHRLVVFIVTISFAMPMVSFSKDHDRIIIVLDCSHNMQQQWDSTTSRYNAASSFALQLIDSAYKKDPNIEFALWAFGHQYSNKLQNCRDVKQEVFFSGNNREQIMMRMEHLYPYGVSNIRNAIETTLSTVNHTDNYNYHMVVITDGSVGCNKNLCSKMNGVSIRTPMFLVTLANPVSDIGCFKNALSAKNITDILEAINTILDECRTKQRHKIALISPAPDDYAFGYLFIKEIGGYVISQLLYKSENNSYTPLTKLSINGLTKGHKIMLKNGSYQLQYSKEGKIIEMAFTISGGQTIEISIL